jgi:hypothetical protein
MIVVPECEIRALGLQVFAATLEREFVLATYCHLEKKMSVPFIGVVFHNPTNIEVTLTVEAPTGTAVSGSQLVRANSTVIIRLGVDNRTLAMIIASDATHSEFKQSFGIAAPSSGLPSYLESVDVRYAIASFS